MNIKNIIGYYRDCLIADKKQQSYWNVFLKRYECLHIVHGDENVITAKDNIYSIQNSYAKDLNKVLKTYSREKDLMHGSFVLIGEIYKDGRKKKIIAPLVCYDATLSFSSIGNENSYVSIDRKQYSLNSDVLKELTGLDVTDFPDNAFSEDNKEELVKHLITWFGMYPEVFDTSLLNQYPSLVGKEEIKKIEKGSAGKIYIAPFSCFYIVKKSLLSQGTIFELDEIFASNDMLKSLHSSLYNGKKFFFKNPRIEPIPCVLSKAQEKIIVNTKKYPTSIVIGPPGTGKSYTISATALEYFVNRKSVLIVSSTEQSLDVIKDKLINEFAVEKNAIIRCGSGGYHKELKNQINRIVNTKAVPEYVNVSKKLLTDILSQIKDLEEEFERNCMKICGHSGLIADNQKSELGLLKKIKLYWIKRGYSKRKLLLEQLVEIYENYKELEISTKKYIRTSWQYRIKDIVQKNRRQLISLSWALRARSSSKQLEMFNAIDFEMLFDALPIWLVSLSNLHRVLPLKENLFDLVIFDESTQCNIASAIPAIVRAKHLLVVGDPKQLRHFSFLSNDSQRQIAEKYSSSDICCHLNYRDQSILDFAQQCVDDNDAITFLDEHFRSNPQIIGFSNNEFYEKQLKIMTKKPFRNGVNSIEIIECGQGKYDSGINQVEANNIIKKLEEIIESDPDVEEGKYITIGVLALFSNQADYLENMIVNALDVEILVQHKIRVGTAYSFQGEERDVMLISCCVDGNCSAANYMFINRDDAFNVAVTRAKKKQIIFLSTRPDKIIKGSHLAKYINYCCLVNAVGDDTKTYKDRFLHEVCSYLQNNGIETILDFSVAGVPVDIAVKSGDNILGIDLVGYPGEFQDYIDLHSFKVLSRTGLLIVPVGFSEWMFSKNKVVSTINLLLDVDGKKFFTDELVVECCAEELIHFDFIQNNEKRIAAIFGELDSLQLSDEREQLLILNKLSIVYMKTANLRLKPESFSFSRFKGLAKSVYEQCLENIEEIIIVANLVKNIENHQLDLPGDGDKQLLDMADEKDSFIALRKNEMKMHFKSNELLIAKIEKLIMVLSQIKNNDDDSDILIESIDRMITVAQQY